jgi:protoporphyrinogen oxidase
MKDDRPVAVIGAGLAGLVAARELSRSGVRVRIFEASRQAADRVAERDEEGFCFDPNAHFITNRLAAALDIGAQCRAVRRFREGVYLEGRHHRLPMGLLGVPRFLLSALDDRARRSRAEPHDAREWFVQRYGAALAEEMAAPLLEAWTGVGAEHLSPALGHRLPGGFRRRLLANLASGMTRSVVPRRSPDVFHVYPEGGARSIVERLVGELGDRIELESPISQIAVERGSVRSICVAGKDVQVRAVVSTAPVNRLAGLVTGSEQLERFKSFRFRPGIFVQLKLEGVHLMPEVVTWVPRGKPFFRVTEAPQSMPWLAPAGKSSLLVEYGAAIGDHLWNLGDAELAEYTLVHIEPLLRDVRRRFIGARVQRSALAYPMLLREYEDQRLALTQGTGVEGLVSVGRNGEFDHLAFEDVYWRTTARVRALAEALRQISR